MRRRASGWTAAHALACLGLLAAVLLMRETPLSRVETADATADGPDIGVGPLSAANGLISVPIVTSGAGFAPYMAYNIHLRWDNNVFQFTSAAGPSGGPFDPTGSDAVCPPSILDSDGGGVAFGCAQLPPAAYAYAGLLATIVLQPVATSGCSVLHLLTLGGTDAAPDGTSTIDLGGTPEANAYADSSSDSNGTPCANPTGMQQTTQVNTTADSVDSSPGDGRCESPTTSSCSLRAAIQEANTHPGENDIWVPPGTYVLTLPGIDEDASVTGDLDLWGNIEIIGSGSDVTTIDAQQIDRVIQVHPGATVGISDVAIVGGNITLQGQSGGGIDNEGSLTLSDVTIANNSAAWAGGIQNYGTVDAFRTVIVGNHADNGGGGLVSQGGVANLTGMYVSGNVAAYAGGLSVFGPVFLHDSTIIGNHATTQVGGGAHVGSASGELTIDQSRITGNTAAFGGGISDEGQLTVNNSTIDDNTATSAPGGAVFVWPESSATATLNNSTVALNSAPIAGGIFNRGKASIYSSTIARNTSTSSGGGSGLYNGYQGNLAIENTIVAQNKGDCVASGESAGHNLDSDGSCNLTGPGDLSSVNPRLGNLTNNGGPILTIPIAVTSPARDAGATSSCPSRDERGFPRPLGSNCDIGAYEVDPNDSDGDGYSDALERLNGQDPYDYCTVMRADVNMDGTVNVLDLSVVAAYFLQSVPPAPTRFDQGPPPVDNRITILDLAKMAAAFLQSESSCP